MHGLAVASVCYANLPNAGHRKNRSVLKVKSSVTGHAIAMALWLIKLIDDQESNAICLETVPVGHRPYTLLVSVRFNLY